MLQTHETSNELTYENHEVRMISKHHVANSCYQVPEVSTRHQDKWEIQQNGARNPQTAVPIKILPNWNIEGILITCLQCLLTQSPHTPHDVLWQTAARIVSLSGTNAGARRLLGATESIPQLRFSSTLDLYFIEQIELIRFNAADAQRIDHVDQLTSEWQKHWWIIKKSGEIWWNCIHPAMSLWLSLKILKGKKMEKGSKELNREKPLNKLNKHLHTPRGRNPMKGRLLGVQGDSSY